MDKLICKKVFSQIGLPQVDYTDTNRWAFNMDCEKELNDIESKAIDVEYEIVIKNVNITKYNKKVRQNNRFLKFFHLKEKSEIALEKDFIKFGDGIVDALKKAGVQYSLLLISMADLNFTKPKKIFGLKVTLFFHNYFTSVLLLKSTYIFSSLSSR